jgi:phage shock protein E
MLSTRPIRRLPALALSVALTVLSGCGTASEIKAIPPGSKIVDVRTPSEFARWHFPGAVNVPVQDIYRRLNELNPSQIIVVYCRSGHRAVRAKQILIDNGFKDVKNGGGLRDMKQLVTSNAAAK